MVSVTSPPARNAPANSKMQAINSAVFKEIAPDPTDVPKAFATSFAPIPHAMMKPKIQAKIIISVSIPTNAIELMN